MSPVHPVLLLTLALLTLASQPSAEEVVESWPDGSIRARYEVDAEGRLHGSFEEFSDDETLVLRAQYRAGLLHGRELRYYENGRKLSVATYDGGVLDGRFESFYPSGKRELTTQYKDGLLSGKQIESSPDGKWVLTAKYELGQLNGSLSIKDHGKTITRQSWSAGTLVSIDGMEPFSRSRAEVLAKVAEIEGAPTEPTTAEPGDEAAIEAERQAALRRLQAYRYLCGLPFEGMQLVPEWNELCRAAAAVCQALGRLSHTPEQPPGMDEELYKKGRLGAGRSNLSMGRQDIAGSIHGYMDDSDPSNIDRIGHRRWCLNPSMKKTGFGKAGVYSAMWSMDGSGSGVSNMEHVLYPPAGFMPVEYFGARHAWSVSFLKGKVPSTKDLAVEITALDDYYLPMGEPLELDYRAVAANGYGGSACAIFRPVGLEVEAGERYRCKLSFDGGRSFELDYIVEFVAPGDLSAN